MEVLESPAPTQRETPTPEPSDEALLGLPPGVSAPSGVDGPLSASVLTNTPPALQIEWYHLEPDAHYEELRLGTGPGVWRGVAFGGLLSVLAVGLFYACMWMVEPSAAFMNPFVDRSYAEARDDIAIHLGGLSPVALKAPSPTGDGSSTTQPAVADKFAIADLRSVHRPSPGGDVSGGTTWYRFDLPREQVTPYRQHMINTWLASLKHRTDEGADDAAFESAGAPPWWDPAEFDPQTRVRLLRANGDTAFQAAFSVKRGRVYIRVNH